ncbi:MAG: glycine cleavage system aminomethyltransferase GcvT [Deltaproteobacteria bacterium]|nr:glycine cleavage system aminomethyltransferase GcvT [Deltaproteobacteria bacterium]
MSTPDPSATPARHTPLHAEHLGLGARMVPFAGYEMPVLYTGVVDEHQAVRRVAGVFDVSHMGEIELRGERALQVIERVITNRAVKLEDGQALYTCACNEQGTILDDLIVYRRRATHWLVVCNAANREKMVRHFAAQALRRCELEDASDRTALIALQGPRALEIAARAGGDGPALGALPSFRLREARLGTVACIAARTGYTGEDGIEVFCAAADAPALWRALLEAGRELGLRPAGLGARDTLRLEARLSLYGNDIDETTNPLEAGLGWVVKLDKSDFIGRQALLRIKEQGLVRKLVGFEMSGRGIARQGYPLCDPSGEHIGTCTSGAPSPTLGKNIGLGYVPVSMAEPGTELLVDCRGRQVGAVVVKTPFYKRPES